MNSDWGVTYSSAADLSAADYHRDFTWSADLQDAYHLSVFAGCGGQLRPCRRPVVAGDGTVTWTDGYMVGCDPSSCLGGCDKDMSGISIAGHIFRFAACQFGQKTAGSPLNALVMSVAQFFARLPDPVYVAAWVDDLHFSMRTPPHPPCLGHVGGCPVCQTAYERAVQAEALWRQKAKALNLPLSDGKGHSVAQGGPFTGVHIDTLHGRYSMLADKLASMRATFAALVNAESATPRLLAQARGKAAHYGCAVQHLASICPALTQAIHQAESAYCLPAPDLTEEASNSDFDWDQSLLISTRTRAALALLIRVTDQLGSAGQPMWPASPIVALENFARGEDSDPAAPTIVALSHSSPAGWGLALRTRADVAPTFLHGSWELAPALLGADWMAQPVFEASGAPQDVTQRHALAILFGFNAASRLSDLSAASLIIRTNSPSSIAALQHGSTADPVLQDIAMLFQAACLELRARRPALLAHASGTEVVLPELRAGTPVPDSSTPALQRILHGAASATGNRFSLDLFASSTNRACARYFSAVIEADSEGCDALSQPNWAQSRCPMCECTRPEFVLLFPPFTLVKAAVQRARQEQAQGIAVVPYAPKASWWHTLINASRPVWAENARMRKLHCCPTYVQNQSNAHTGHFIAIIAFDFWTEALPRPSSCIHMHLPRLADTERLRQDLSDMEAIDTLLASPH